jgi:hypothetical protein
LTVLTFFSRESFNGHTTLRNDIVTQRDHAESTDCITSSSRPRPKSDRNGCVLRTMSIGYGALHALMASGGVRLATDGGAKIAR